MTPPGCFFVLLIPLSFWVTRNERRTICDVPCGQRILDECRQETRNAWPDGKPKSLLCSLPVVVIWLAVGALIIKRVWR
jgi:hypothetical protein